MNDTIKQFLIGLGFSIDEAGLKKFINGVSSASMRAAALGAAATAATGLILKGINDVAKEAEQLSLLAENYNTTAAAMDDFADVAGIVGIGQDQALEGFREFNKNVGSAALGVGRAKLVFEKLGIAVKDSNGHMRSSSLVLEDVKKKIEGMDRGQAVAIMRRIGLDPALLRMFNNDLGNTTDIAKELSAIDSSVGFDFDKGQTEAKAYMKSQREMMVQARLLKMWFDKLWERLATDLMPKARMALERLGRTFEDIRRQLQDNGAKIVGAITPMLHIINRIAEAFIQFLARGISVVNSVIGTAISLWGKLQDITGGLAGKILLVVAAWKYLNLSFLKSPLGMLIALAAAALLLYDDFMTWKEGGDSLIDWGSDFGEMLMYSASLVAGLGVAVLATKAIMAGYAITMNMVTIAMGAYQAVLKTLQVGMLLFNLIMTANPIGLIVVAIAALIAAGVLLVANWSTVKDWFKDFFKWFGDKFDSMSKMASSLGSIFGGGASAPSPQARAAVSGGANVNQATNIHVSGGANPQATAQAVAAKQKEVNASMTRNVRGAAR